MMQFDGLAEEYGFQVLDATKSIEMIFRQLRSGIQRVLKSEDRSGPLPLPLRKLPGEFGDETTTRPIKDPQVVEGGKAAE
jgi:hypothetical protein